jgi:hypothetical protein
LRAMSNQLIIRGKKFERPSFPVREAAHTLVCWLEDGRQYKVEGSVNGGYLATFVNGYTGKVLERLSAFPRQYSAMYCCLRHAEDGGPEKFEHTGEQSWELKKSRKRFSGAWIIR